MMDIEQIIDERIEVTSLANPHTCMEFKIINLLRRFQWSQVTCASTIIKDRPEMNNEM